MSQEAERAAGVQVFSSDVTRVTVSSSGSQPQQQQSAPSAAQPSAEQQPQSPNKAALTWNADNSEQVQDVSQRVTSVNAADLYSAGREGILKTARTRHGGPARELNGDVIVTANGLEMRLSDAEAAGLVKRDAAGQYVETTSAERAAGSRSEASSSQMETFPPEVEAALVHLSKGADQQMLTGILGEWARTYAVTGNMDHVNPARLASMAREYGSKMSDEEASQFTQFALQVFSAQAEGALRSSGVPDTQEFVQWAREHRPAQFKRAVTEHIGSRQLGVYRALAAEFLRSNAPSREAISTRFNTKTDPKSGRTLVEVAPGMWTTAEAAARLGSI